MDNQDYKMLKEDNNPLKIDKDLIEIQKMIIYYGETILKEIESIKNIPKEKQINKLSFKPMDNQIIRHLIEKQIPEECGGNNLKR